MFRKGWAGLLFGMFLLFSATGVPAEQRVRYDLMPMVIELSADEMQNMWCGGRKGCTTAMMLYGEGTIYVLEGYYPKTIAELSALLHEFVHHLQYLAGRKGWERCYLERQAYDMQDAWFAVNGEEPEPGVDMPGPMLRMLITNCGE